VPFVPKLNYVSGIVARGTPMFSFDVGTEIGHLRQRLTDTERVEVPWAMKLALDDTAKAVISIEQD
jgi:hypothetical protein